MPGLSHWLHKRPALAGNVGGRTAAFERCNDLARDIAGKDYFRIALRFETVSLLESMLGEFYMAFKNDEERRAYFREYNKGWYQKHRERLLEKRRQYDEALKAWLRQYKSNLCCVECGENHPACIQFHHRDREEKSFTIGSIIGRRRYIALKKLKEEISKCEVLCGNCHAIRHWRETHDFDDWREVLPTLE